MAEATLFAEMERSAWLSPCGRYRHALARHWDRSLGYVLFIGLNPSTADAEKDDPTIRRCIRFARDWGYGGIEMCNLFDWRSTDPKRLRRLQIATSDKNDPVLRLRAAKAKIVIAAWGAVPWAHDRIDAVFRGVFRFEEENSGKRWHALELTKGKFPRHPLYVPAAAQPVLFW